MRGGPGAYSGRTGVDQSFDVWLGGSGSLEGFEPGLGGEPSPGFRSLEIAGIVGFLTARLRVGLAKHPSEGSRAAMYRGMRQDTKLLFFLGIGLV